MNILKKINLENIIIMLFFFTAPYTVSSMFQRLIPVIPTSVFIQLIVASYMAIYLLKRRTIVLTRFESNTMLLFIIPIVLSIIGVFIAFFIFEKNIAYQNYVYSNLFDRLFLVVLNITILVGLLTMTNNWSMDSIISLVRKYYNGLVIFALVGVWQFIYFFLDIPFLNLETRSYIHSVQNVSFFIGRRVTSFAAEPSYLAPFVIDLMILAFLVSKKPLRSFLLGLFVLIFSYSGGGYLNILILIIAFVLAYLKYSGFRFKRNYVVLGSITLFAGTMLLVNYIEVIKYVIFPVLGRLDTIFDIQRHARMFMIIMPFIWVLRGSIVNAFFGYGANSYNYLGSTEYLPRGGSVHKTSNNFFSDTVFELGYFGFLCYIAIFSRFIIKTFGSVKKNKPMFISFLLSIHLVASSIYRADFMQPRFWVLVFIILKLIKIGETKQITIICQHK